MPHTLEKQSLAEGSAISPLAGKPAPKELLIDPVRLQRDYYERKPDVSDPNQLVAFGTSGHRGSALNGTFNEAHILAITQAICEYRKGQGIDGPLYMGKDTHAVSEPAQRTALGVLAANGVETIIQENGGVTPTPVISHAILVYNRGRKDHHADGIVITPSHNPPADGGFKYNPPNGGPADTEITGWVQSRANDLLRSGNKEVKRVPISSVVLSSQRIEQKQAIYDAAKAKEREKEEAVNPLVQSGSKLIPSVTRVFSSGRSIYVYLQAYKPPSPDTPASRDPLVAFVSLYSGDAEVLKTPPVAVEPNAGTRLGVVPLSFDLGINRLAPGEYQCQVTVLDPVTSKATFWRAPIAVTP